MSDVYFVRFRGEVIGPFTAGELKAQVTDGRLSPIHSISPDRENWSLAKTFDWLYPAIGTSGESAQSPAPAPAAPAVSSGARYMDLPLSEVPSASPNANRRSRSPLRLVVLLGIPLLILALVALLTWWLVRRGSNKSPDAPTTLVAPQAS